MPTVELDKVEGSSLEVGTQGARYLRMGKVRDIDLTSSPDAEALVKVMSVSGVPQINESLSSSYSYMKVKRIRIVPIDPRNPNDVGLEIEYRYERDTFTPTIYIVRDDSYAQQEQTAVVPGTGEVVTVGFTSATESIIPDIVVFNVFKPVRAISITALRYGRPTGGFQDKMTHVNDADWPVGQVAVSGAFDNAFGPDSSGSNQPSATALPKGYWMLARYSTEHHPTRGIFTVQAQAITRVIEDWSAIGVMQNRDTGKYPFGSLSTGDQETQRTAIMGPAYSYGIIHTGNGIVRVGHYPTTNFEALFGF